MGRRSADLEIPGRGEQGCGGGYLGGGARQSEVGHQSTPILRAEQAARNVG
jgi:hypothetical protein